MFGWSRMSNLLPFFCLQTQFQSIPANQHQDATENFVAFRYKRFKKCDSLGKDRGEAFRFPEGQPGFCAGWSFQWLKNRPASRGLRWEKKRHQYNRPYEGAQQRWTEWEGKIAEKLNVQRSKRLKMGFVVYHDITSPRFTEIWLAPQSLTTVKITLELNMTVAFNVRFRPSNFDG